MKKNKAFIIVIVLLVISVIFALTTGRYHIKLGTLWDVIVLKLTNQTPTEELATPAIVLWSVRMPRVIMALLAGAALSVGGVVFQGIMRNPLVSPSLLGVTQGATFGASLAIIFIGKSAFALEGLAFFWAITAVFIVYQIGNRGINSVTTLVLAGVVISAVFMAGGSFLKYIADPYEELPAIVFWTMGGLNNILWANVSRAFTIISIGIIFIYIFRWRLNLMSLGDEEAMAMGVNVKSARALYMIFGTVIVAASSSSCGSIMWVDLVVAHISRLIIGPDHNDLIPFSALTGGLFLLLMDTIVRILPGGEMPISIITSFIGAPFLGYLLLRQNAQVWKG
jgi:iron complex transport system permease protein